MKLKNKNKAMRSIFGDPQKNKYDNSFFKDLAAP